jgi:hypothetical protein
MMEETLIDLHSFKSLPDSIIHLSLQFNELGALIANEERKICFNPNIVGLVCMLFLSIFDALPIYCKLFTDEDWRRALTAKKLASLVHDYRLIMGNIYYKSLNRARLAKFKNESKHNNWKNH